MSIVPKLKEHPRPKTRLRKNATVGANGRAGFGTAAIWEPSGWLALEAPYRKVRIQNPLVHHANFRGPVKLIGAGGNIRQLTEMFVSRELFGDRVFDSDSNEQCESLLAELSASVFANRSPDKKLTWRAPDAEQLVDWLTAGGFHPVLDAEDNLRLTLKARGCDGQVYVCRDDQSLRMTMRLGSWSGLGDETEKAMVHLARQANDRGHLARIAWIVDSDARRCEAQIDLTGIPTDGPARRVWPGMLRMSMHGLGLALRRLGMELEALADPSNRGVAAQLISHERI
jgi:hypothetical protein